MLNSIKKTSETNGGITLIALVITIIVLLILAGVTIATLTGDNGLLQKATSAKQENEEAAALEKIKVEVAGSYGLDGKIDNEQLNKNLKKINGLTYNENEIDLNDDTKKISLFPATVKLNGYLYEIEENGKVNNKTGITLSSSNLSMAPGDTETLTVTFVGMNEENITWTSETPGVATVENGVVTAVASGTAKITATCGTKNAICIVTVASKLANVVNIGDYVNINIEYEDKKVEDTTYSTTAWRVLNKNITAGTVKLISTGNPLTFHHPAGGDSTSGATSVTELKTIESGSITIQTSSNTRGYQANGFNTTNIAEVFSNTDIFNGITLPVQSDFTGIGTDNNVRTTGYAYWLGDDIYSGGDVTLMGSKGAILYDHNRTFAVRPVVLLKSGVTIKDGEGTSTLPYRLNGINY